MGGELKPSLELVLSAPFVLDELREAGPPVTEQPRFTFEDDRGRSEVAPATRRRRFPGPSPAADQAEADDDTADGAEDEFEETVTGGTDDERGRIITLRSTRRPDR